MLNENKYNQLTLSRSLNTLLILGFLISMLLNVIQGVGIYTSIQYIKKKQRIFTPPQISREFSLSDTIVDASYLQMMAEYFADLKLNVTPASVDRKYKLLAGYIKPSNWGTLQPLLSKDAGMVKKKNISSHWTANEVLVSLDENKVKLSGVIEKSVGERKLAPEAVTYIIDMDFLDGEISLASIKKLKRED